MIREKRDSRLTADISERAHDLLKDAVIKFDSSKGKLVEKMINSFLGGDTEPKTDMTPMKNKVPKKSLVKRFVPPTVEEVREYCDSRCNNVDPKKFVDHYTTNGWVRGKSETKIKCWKACVRTWEGSDKDKQLNVNGENLGGNW